MRAELWRLSSSLLEIGLRSDSDDADLWQPAEAEALTAATTERNNELAGAEPTSTTQVADAEPAAEPFAHIFEIERTFISVKEQGLGVTNFGAPRNRSAPP